MKKLIFVRHGRAEDSSADIPDFERSLTIKGKTISRKIARELKEIENSPGVMITSPAFRALETAIIFAQAFEIQPEKIILNSNLYHKMNFNYLREVLSAINEDSDSITFFGHNPSFTEIAGVLCSGGCDFIPKSGVIGISFSITRWQEIKRNSGKIEYFLKPEKTL
jgi:phosphohistidine phosphatase